MYHNDAAQTKRDSENNGSYLLLLGLPRDVDGFELHYQAIDHESDANAKSDVPMG